MKKMIRLLLASILSSCAIQCSSRSEIISEEKTDNGEVIIDEPNIDENENNDGQNDESSDDDHDEISYVDCNGGSLDKNHPNSWLNFWGPSNDRTNSSNGTINNPNLSWMNDAATGDYTGLVYSDKIIYATNNSNGVYALDSATGTILWQFPGIKITTSPAFHDNILYFGDEQGVVYALDINTQNLVWKYNADDAIASNIVLSIDNNLVYFASSMRTNDNGFTYALKINDGTLVWEKEITRTVEIYQTNRESTLFNFCGLLISFNSEYGINAYDAKSGQLAWKQQNTSIDRASYMHFSDGIFYFASNPRYNKLEVIPIDNMSFVNFDYDIPSSSTPYIEGDIAYVFDNFTNNQIKAYNLTTGEFLWGTNTRINTISLISAPAVTEKELYYHTATGYLYSINKLDGTINWSKDTSSYDLQSLVSIPSPLIVGKAIYLASEKVLKYE